MCGILLEFVEAEDNTAKKPKSDKQHFRAGIRNADRNKALKLFEKSCKLEFKQGCDNYELLKNHK